jgi:osmotically-inducible protein OsmY
MINSDQIKFYLPVVYSKDGQFTTVADMGLTNTIKTRPVSLMTSKIKAELINQPGLSSADINIETFKGIVQLSGFANTPGDITKAVAIARSVGGVKSVKNAMRLK